VVKRVATTICRRFVRLQPAATVPIKRILLRSANPLPTCRRCPHRPAMKRRHLLRSWHWRDQRIPRR
jgi:hypothetical protein